MNWLLLWHDYDLTWDKDQIRMFRDRKNPRTQSQSDVKYLYLLALPSVVPYRNPETSIPSRIWLGSLLTNTQLYPLHHNTTSDAGRFWPSHYFTFAQQTGSSFCKSLIFLSIVFSNEQTLRRCNLFAKRKLFCKKRSVWLELEGQREGELLTWPTTTTTKS